MPATRTRRASTSTAIVARGFAAMAGHQRAIGILKAHRRTGRLAHAYCLTGEESIGKTAVARALAEELLLGGGQPSRLDGRQKTSAARMASNIVMTWRLRKRRRRARVRARARPRRGR